MNYLIYGGDYGNTRWCLRGERERERGRVIFGRKKHAGNSWKNAPLLTLAPVAVLFCKDTEEQMDKFYDPRRKNNLVPVFEALFILPNK